MMSSRGSRQVNTVDNVQSQVNTSFTLVEPLAPVVTPTHNCSVLAVEKAVQSLSKLP